MGTIFRGLIAYLIFAFNLSFQGKITGGEYTTFSALTDSKDEAGAMEDRDSAIDGSKPSTEPNATIPGITHTLPRYTIAGNNGTNSGGAAVIGVQPSPIPSTVSSSVNTFGSSLPRMSAVERVGLTGKFGFHSLC